jgi:hypothetical protein
MPKYGGARDFTSGAMREAGMTPDELKALSREELSRLLRERLDREANRVKAREEYIAWLVENEDDRRCYNALMQILHGEDDDEIETIVRHVNAKIRSES